MKNRAFLVNTLVLTATALTLRAIGIYLTACLSRRIGSEGVGLYHLVYSVYVMASALSASGFGVAVSRLVAEALEKGKGQAAPAVMGRAAALSVGVSLAVGAALYLGAGFIGARLLGDERTVLSLRLMAPSLPFMAVSSCLRGYFLAVRKAPKSAAASLLEQLFRLAVTLPLLALTAGAGLELACAAVVAGSTLAEVFSFLFALAMYVRERRGIRGGRPAAERTAGLFRRIAAIAAPLAASSGLRTGLRTAESLLIPAGLRRSGLSESAALTQYGVVNGMAVPVMLFPSSLLMSVSMLIVPEIARAAAAGRQTRVRSMAARVIRATLLVSFPIAAVLAVFSGELCMAIYQNRSAGGVLAILSPLVPLLYLDHVVDGMLSGLNQQTKTLQYNTADSALRIAMIGLLTPLWGMSGYIVMLFVSTLFNVSLSVGRLLRVSGVTVSAADWVVKPVLSAALAAVSASLLFRWAFPLRIASGSLAAAEIALTVLLYGGLLWMGRCVGRDDIRWAKGFFAASGGSAEGKSVRG